MDIGLGLEKTATLSVLMTLIAMKSGFIAPFLITWILMLLRSVIRHRVIRVFCFPMCSHLPIIITTYCFLNSVS